MKRLYNAKLVSQGLENSDVSNKHHCSTYADLAEKLWSKIGFPFHKSIRARIQFALALAITGLVVMAVITILSGRILLDMYESSVFMSRFETMPVYQLQVSLRQAERMASLYAIDGDTSVHARLKQIEDAVDSNLRQLSMTQLRLSSVDHAHSHISLPEVAKAWQRARTVVQKVFQHTPGTTDAINALSRASAVIDPIYKVTSEFHHLSMEDLQERLRSARRVADWTYYALSAAILLGLGLLIIVALIICRSILNPIDQLQRAAVRLCKKDFSHRVKLRNTQDELGQLGTAFNSAAASLQLFYNKLERCSTHDGLTGVMNRAVFDQRLAAECKSADRLKRPLSLLMVDIDFFKRVNDNYGHQAGDRVLQAIARLLNEATRPGDVVTRYRGEEFAIILPETDEDSAMAMAERLRKIIETFSFEGVVSEDINVTVSLGCATRGPYALTPQEFVKAVDEALYRAKKTGRNRVCVSKPPLTEQRTRPQTA